MELACSQAPALAENDGVPTVDVVLPALTASAALAAAIFTALRFNRDDATAIVNQHKVVLEGMRGLNDELEAALERARVRANEAEARVTVLEAEIVRLGLALAAASRGGSSP